LRLLLDTNIIIMLAQNDCRMPSACKALLAQPETEAVVSTIAFWEIGIKYRSGKLELFNTPDELRAYMPDWGIEVLALTSRHAVADPALPAPLKDPFDRMLVAIAEVEQMRFLTTDAKLLDHHLAWRP
jgi:PIN domain nuclease of toxin-antitoxin system